MHRAHSALSIVFVSRGFSNSKSGAAYPRWVVQYPRWVVHTELLQNWTPFWCLCSQIEYSKKSTKGFKIYGICTEIFFNVKIPSIFKFGTILNFAASFPKCKIRCVQLWDKEPLGLSMETLVEVYQLRKAFATPLWKIATKKKAYIPENERLDNTQNDGPWKRWTPASNMAIFGINSLDFWGVIHLPMPTYSSSQSMPDFGTLDLLGGWAPRHR